VASGSPTYDGNLAAGARLVERVAKLQDQGAMPNPVPPDAVFAACFSDPSFPLEHPDENAVQTAFNQDVNRLTWAADQGFDFTAEVGRLRHRVLIIFGEDDPAGRPLIEKRSQRSGPRT
jgi:pimeloyl-ACP methyl ester carboxylesterase